MSSGISIPPLRDLSPGRLSHLRQHLLAEIEREGQFDRTPAPLPFRGLGRRQAFALAVAALVVAVGTASAIGGVRDFVLHRGFIGLPPMGAMPSAPESGQLEILYSVGGPKEHLGRSRAWVYADGRLIWLRENADIPERANPMSTGFLEQRLTPNGVELLRSEIASAGKFRDETPRPPSLPPCPTGGIPAPGECEPVPPPAPDEPITVPFYTAIEVVGLGWLVHVDRARDLERLEARLSDPESWLPADAWADRKIRAYVPSKFEVCSLTLPWHRVDPSDVLSLLPAKVKDALDDSEPRKEDWSSGPHYCSDVSTEQARALAAALDGAGFERHAPAYTLSYRFRVPDVRAPAFIYFYPYLPHGETTCLACG